MFVDEVRIYARAGKGGPGCVAFHREAFRPKGGPSGGNGGRGGSVILEASHDVHHLIAQYYQPRLVAANGQPGSGKGRDGLAGRDLVISVPCGTVVWRVPPPKGFRSEVTSDDAGGEADDGMLLDDGTGDVVRARIRQEGGAQALEIDLEAEDDSGGDLDAGGEDGASGEEEVREEVVADLTEHGQRFVLCEGGRGGKGNRHFATSVRQAPRFAQPGEGGTEGHFRLELRTMADVGLVGYPNAGKSTLLTAISKARPKVAPYPFTTLHPQIGIVEYPDFVRLVVCDVPGIIEGAHRNVGLGHAFLKHISRCRVLVVVLDMAGTDGREPWDDYEQVLSELSLYTVDLGRLPRVVAANKMDEDAAAENLEEFGRRYPGVEVLPLAAAFDEGIEAFKDRIRTLAASG